MCFIYTWVKLINSVLFCTDIGYRLSNDYSTNIRKSVASHRCSKCLWLCTGQLNVNFEPTSDSNDRGLAVDVGKFPDVAKQILTVEMIIPAMTKKG
jgi:hypothetical protein